MPLVDGKKEVKVKLTVQSGHVFDRSVRIDDDKVPLNADGEGAKPVAPGAHTLSYFVKAATGTEFTMAITAPQEAVWSRDITVSDDEIFLGAKRFRVNQS